MQLFYMGSWGLALGLAETFCFVTLLAVALSSRDIKKI